MAYNPQVQPMAGEYFMRGMQGLGEGIAKGIEGYAANKRQRAALTGIIEGYGPERLKALSAKMTPEGQKLTEKFVTGKATGNDMTALAGFLQATTKIQEDEQQQQMRQLQLQELAAQAQERQRRETFATMARNVASGAGAGVVSPQLQNNPFFKLSGQAQQAGMGVPRAGEVMNYLGQQQANDTRLAVQDARGESAKELAGLRADLATAKGEDKKKADAFKDSTTLRNDFYGMPSVKEFQTVDNYFTRGRVLAKDDSGAGDIGLMFSYMKVLDPTSVVREGEYATVQNSGSVPEGVRNVYNRAMSGEKLTPEQRQKFVQTMKHSAEVQYDKLKPIIDQYTTLAKKHELAEDDIVPEVYRKWSPDRESTVEQRRTTEASGSLSRDEAVGYLQRAGGDKQKARELARKDGKTF